MRFSFHPLILFGVTLLTTLFTLKTIEIIKKANIKDNLSKKKIFDYK
ncbi:hypothetical protein CLOSPI_00369 [Thomasclavelia spiroformis DSM 1552]|uniref:Uncharacterized protein n=1 Tax=Thomasclavelia spiroformis DSM 1552 TaxID=428126 RepID=B1BZJ2_9FIRM|nr:hypothetical protein CLOSPI_00369 [Thomasclavelia spiroformis DSM 1552]